MPLVVLGLEVHVPQALPVNRCARSGGALPRCTVACGHCGLWALWPVGTVACGHCGLWHRGLWALWPVALWPGHCGLWALWPVALWPVGTVACGHYGLWALWPRTVACSLWQTAAARAPPPRLQRAARGAARRRARGYPAKRATPKRPPRGLAADQATGDERPDWRTTARCATHTRPARLPRGAHGGRAPTRLVTTRDACRGCTTPRGHAVTRRVLRTALGAQRPLACAARGKRATKRTRGHAGANVPPTRGARGRAHCGPLHAPRWGRHATGQREAKQGDLRAARDGGPLGVSRVASPRDFARLVPSRCYPTRQPRRHRTTYLDDEGTHATQLCESQEDSWPS